MFACQWTLTRRGLAIHFCHVTWHTTQYTYFTSPICVFRLGLNSNNFYIHRSSKAAVKKEYEYLLSVCAPFLVSNSSSAVTELTTVYPKSKLSGYFRKLLNVIQRHFLSYRGCLETPKRPFQIIQSMQNTFLKCHFPCYSCGRWAAIFIFIRKQKPKLGNEIKYL